MDNYLRKLSDKRRTRVWRIRKHIKKFSSAPRLCVQKTNQHLSAQIIDDEKGITVASIGTLSKEMRKGNKPLRKSKAAAKEIGTKLAKLAKEKSIDKVVFDRGRFKFHGLIAELATAAREAGLKF